MYGILLKLGDFLLCAIFSVYVNKYIYAYNCLVVIF